MVLLCLLLDARRKDYMQNSCQPMEQHLALATVCSRLLHLPLEGLGPCLDFSVNCTAQVLPDSKHSYPPVCSAVTVGVTAKA